NAELVGPAAMLRWRASPTVVLDRSAYRSEGVANCLAIFGGTESARPWRKGTSHDFGRRAADADLASALPTASGARNGDLDRPSAVPAGARGVGKAGRLRNHQSAGRHPKRGHGGSGG